MKCLSSGSLIMANKRQACLHYVGPVDAYHEDMVVGPHDAIMASCGVPRAALSDKITIVSSCRHKR